MTSFCFFCVQNYKKKKKKYFWLVFFTVFYRLLKSMAYGRGLFFFFVANSLVLSASLRCIKYNNTLCGKNKRLISLLLRNFILKRHSVSKKICIFAFRIRHELSNWCKKSICKRSSLKLPVSKQLVDMILMPFACLVCYVFERQHIYSMG